MQFLKNVVKNLRSYIFVITQKTKWRNLQKLDRVKLNLGSGAIKGANGWTTVDIKGSDILHDLRFGIPLKEASVDNIYCSHFLEHLTGPKTLEFLEKCIKVLKVGGEISIAVPDARRYIDAYIKGEYFSPEDKIYTPAFFDTGSLIDQVNYMAYMDGHHCFMYDRENLKNILLLAGFEEVTDRSFDSSIDIIDRDFESIYIKAKKE